MSQTPLSQAECWNGRTGQKWTALQDVWDRTLQPALSALMERAQVRPGERVVDIGCGCGATTLALGQAAGPDGFVLGIDISQVMLERTRERARNHANIQLELADAANWPFPAASFDLLFSRLGVMFFDDPIVAFTNLRRALRPGGRLVFMCHRHPRENPYFMVPYSAATPWIPPQPKQAPNTPGPFAFADPIRVQDILGAAGFINVVLEPVDLLLDVSSGGGLEGAVSTLMTLGPTGSAADALSEAGRSQLTQALHDALAPYVQGVTVPLTGGMWVATSTSS